MSKKRGDQVTCRGCSAYSFPHRLGGGSCTGADWANSYLTHEREYCDCCPLLQEGQCQVAQGLESIQECPGYQEHKRMQLGPAHPTTESELLEDLYGESHRGEERPHNNP